MTLYPQLSIDHEETLLSYTDRLSMMHTGQGMERLLKDCGINKEYFISGRAEAISILAEATGHSFKTLQQNAIRVFQRCSSFRGEEISKPFLSPRAAQYCPVCLSEDGNVSDRRFRLIWGFRHVNRCDVHSVWLEGAPIAVATNLRVALGASPIARANDADYETPEYLVWLRDRTHGPFVESDHWLNRQTVEQVLAASEMLGAILEHGHAAAVTKLTAAQTEEATDIGFSIYREGPSAIEEALDTIRQNSSATAVQAGPLAYYGKLFDWLDRRSNAVEPGPIRDILREHIVKHSAVEPGTTVLGVEINNRRFHTIYTLSSEVGIARPRLSRLLRKLGEVPQSATEIECGNMVFEATKVTSLIEAFKTAVPLWDVPDYLCASKRQVEILYRINCLKPLVPKTGRGSVRHVVFARHHLDELLAKIFALPELTCDPPASFHPLTFACQHGAGPFEEIFPSILAGQIPAFRHSEKSGVSAVFIDMKTIPQVVIST